MHLIVENNEISNHLDLIVQYVYFSEGSHNHIHWQQKRKMSLMAFITQVRMDIVINSVNYEEAICRNTLCLIAIINP